MRILLIGGTGAMGAPLTEILGKNKEHEVLITSRKFRVSKYNNIDYIKGNAHEVSFLSKILEERFDVIIDFMKYEDNEFQSRLELLLKRTGQYIFISSCRVFSNNSKVISESSDKLLDTIDDEYFLTSDEYSLSKARQEEILKESQYHNWTIVRPYITYNNNRLQLGIYEKEDWLYRAINGLPIVFGRDMASCTTTLTLGYDVSMSIFGLIGNKSAIGEEFNIVNSENVTWNDVINIYSDELEKVLGFGLKIHWIESSQDIAKVMHAEYQCKYDRLFNRKFSNEKLNNFLDSRINFVPVEMGLRRCLKNFISDDNKEFKNIPWKLSAYMDKITGERTSFNVFPTSKTKLKYIICRYTPYFKYILPR